MFKAVVIACSLIAAPAAAADVTVTVRSIKAKGGTVLVGLWDKGTFMTGEHVFHTEASGKDAGEVTVRFLNVPPGDYAVNAFHDADDDRQAKMEKGRLAEGTALSNAEALRGPPNFEVNKVAVPSSGTKVIVEMSYPEDRQGW